MTTQQPVLSQVDLTVTDGPSLWKVILALFDRQSVEFTIQTMGIGKVKAYITFISVDKGKNGSWKIGGAIFQTDLWGLTHDSHPFNGSYDPRARTGDFSVKAIVAGGPNSLTNSLLLLHGDRSRAGDLFRNDLARELKIPVRGGILDTSNVPGFLDE